MKTSKYDYWCVFAAWKRNSLWTCVCGVKRSNFCTFARNIVLVTSKTSVQHILFVRLVGWLVGWRVYSNWAMTGSSKHMCSAPRTGNRFKQKWRMISGTDSKGWLNSPRMNWPVSFCWMRICIKPRALLWNKDMEYLISYTIRYLLTMIETYFNDSEKSLRDDSQLRTRKLPSRSGRNVHSASTRVIEPWYQLTMKETHIRSDFWI